MFWDFLSLTPESIHQVTILFSDRGTPKTYRHMNGYSSHTFKWYNEKGESFWINYQIEEIEEFRTSPGRRPPESRAKTQTMPRETCTRRLQKATIRPGQFMCRS